MIGVTNPPFSVASCENCGQHIEFPSEGVGVRISCPHCAAETVLLPEPAREPELLQEITAAELKEALSGTVRRPRISVFYQAGLLLVAVFMVLLPVAYLAFAALAAAGVWWYGVHATVLFSNLSGGVYVLIFKVILYFAPLLAGSIAVFFMFKPLLARPPKRATPLELNPAEHPRLYQFIAHLSDLLRVPLPRRIYLDCELNASAGFGRGWLSVLTNDLVLNLGLPLVSGLTARQFAAVISHELGHCTQSLAMRLGFVINRIDRWFVRVVYERDTWDDAFEEWVDSVEDWRLSLIMGCATFAVWLSRRVLAMLMLAGHAASCFLSRQMEFHADSCAMAVAGSEGLESLLLRLREQSIIEQIAYSGLQQVWQKRHQMPESLPDFLEQCERRLPAEFHEQARMTLLNETAGLFATHPTAAQRIKKARRRAIPGLFAIPKPARALFHDFQATARVVTARHYRQNMRLAVTNPMLKPVADFFQDPAEKPVNSAPERKIYRVGASADSDNTPLAGGASS